MAGHIGLATYALLEVGHWGRQSTLVHCARVRTMRLTQVIGTLIHPHIVLLRTSPYAQAVSLRAPANSDEGNEVAGQRQIPIGLVLDH